MDLGNDIYDLDEEDLATMEEHVKFLDIKEKDDNEL